MKRIHIDTIHLRLQGLPVETGRQMAGHLGNDLRAGLADRSISVPGPRRRNTPAMNAGRLTVARTVGSDTLSLRAAQAIANQIEASLQPTTTDRKRR